MDKFLGHPSLYPKAYLEVPHSNTYAFTNNGSFTIEFLMNKATETYACNNVRPIIRKSGVFDLSFSSPCFSTSFMTISHPGGSTNIVYANFLGNNLYNRTVHVALTWSVQNLGNGNYSGSFKLYLNSRLALEDSYSYLDTFPNTNVNTPFEIAGRGDLNNILLDRHTTSFRIDQIAVYDKELSMDVIADHYSKIFPYEEMITNDFASNHWTFNDADSLTNFDIVPRIGSLYGKYKVDRSQIVRQQPGPPGIPLSSSATFQNRGCAQFISYIPGRIIWNSSNKFKLYV